MGSTPRNLFKKELLFQVPEGGKYSKNHLNGNMNCAQLDELITKLGVENVPLIFTTITNNTVFGQSISMKSIKKIAKICEKYNISLILDVARWAENCYFIKKMKKEDTKINPLLKLPQKCSHIVKVSACQLKKMDIQIWMDW